ncbi:MAG: hypothetical protein ACK4NC_06750 [Candidatus Gracilibacteria bacterium]
MPIPKEIDTGFKLEEELLWKEEIPVEEIKLSELDNNLDIPYLESKGTDDWNMSPRMLWENFENEAPHAKRVNEADMQYPIDIYFFRDQWIIVDGVHRFTKAHMLGLETIRVRRVSDEVVERTRK